MGYGAHPLGLTMPSAKVCEVAMNQGTNSYLNDGGVMHYMHYFNIADFTIHYIA